MNKNTMNFSLKQTKLFVLFIIGVVSLFYFPELVYTQGESGTVFSKLFNGFFGLILQLFEGILKFCQHIFLVVINFTILKFSNIWTGDILASGLKSLWLIVRDVVNLFIVVFFLLTALLTIFGEFKFNRKILLGLLLAAIFVNFSAFFTLFALDVSHAIFILFLSILDIETFASISPFSGLDTKLLALGGKGLWWNVMFTLIVVASNFFLALGLLYFSLILIERFIVAILLVVFSPFAVIGYFVEVFGSKIKMFSIFSNIWSVWRERFVYTLTVPIILIFGLIIVLEIFSSVLARTIPDINTIIALQGPEALNLLAGATLASIVLIMGVFQVAKLAKNANIHQKFSKYGLGTVTTNIIHKSPWAAKGILRNIPGIRRIKPHNERAEVSRKVQAGGRVLSGIAGGVASGKHVPFGKKEVSPKTGEVVDNTFGIKYRKEYNKIKASEEIAQKKRGGSIAKYLEKKAEKEEFGRKELRKRKTNSEDSELLREFIKKAVINPSDYDRKRGEGRRTGRSGRNPYRRESNRKKGRISGEKHNPTK